MSKNKRIGTPPRFAWPNPPFFEAALDPDVSAWLDADGGLAQDNHQPPAFVEPRNYVTVNPIVAWQQYQYRCPGVNNFNEVTMAVYSITRSVSQNPDDSWKYEVFKNGASASIDPLPE